MSVGTGCCIPRLVDPVVHRPRLMKLLADRACAPVTLVSGPPGAGKTTLLVSWVRSLDDRPAAWLTVDSRDDQPDQLADLVVEALHQAGVLTEPLQTATGTSLLDVAFEQLLALGHRCVLVLEDVKELRGPSTLRILSHLLERAPAGLDVVLSTRADPPIAWDRL